MKLELRDLSCGYAKPILRHVDFELNSGEIGCVLGPNGVGKTTLFKTILNILPPLSGTIAIDGENTRSWKERQLARYMAYVAQAAAEADSFRED